jgi:hypothetical protein
VFWWRRGHPLDIATATTTTLIVVSPAFGNQYLQWPVPSSIARPTRLTMTLQIVVGAYAAVFYLPLFMVHGHAWQDVDNAMMFVSLAVAALMVIALPWGRRVWHRPTLPAGNAKGGEPALDSPVPRYVANEVLPEHVPDHEVLAESLSDTAGLAEGQTNMPN